MKLKLNEDGDGIKSICIYIWPQLVGLANVTLAFVNISFFEIKLNEKKTSYAESIGRCT